jgi:hypothetical protein
MLLTSRQPTRPALSDRRIIANPSPLRQPSRPDSRIKYRDSRLDFLRGLCLIDMVLIHLVYQNVQFGKAMGSLLSYSRFAAGGFIFVAGMGIGTIFLPKVRDPLRRADTYRSLWYRTVYLLGVQYLNAMGLLGLETICGIRATSTNPLIIWRDVLLLREGGDLLPFYVMMIALSPLLLELFRRRRGWMVALGGSGILFAIGRNHPWLFAIAAHGYFPPILWQFIFILGLAFGSVWKEFAALGKSIKISIGAGAAIIFGLLFVSEYSSDFGWPGLNLGVGFTKVPLSFGETLRYLSLFMVIVCVTDLAWPILSESIPARFVQTLGRKSLPVYVAHLWIVELAGWLAVTWWWMGAWQISFGVVAIGLLWVFAWRLDVRKSAVKSRRLVPAYSSRTRDAAMGSVQ